MNPVDQNSTQTSTEGRHRVLLILWFAFLMSVVFYFAITIIVPRAATGQSDGMLFFVLAAAGASLVVFSVVLKRKLLGQSVEKQRPDLVQTAYIVALALCEAAGIFGLVLYFATTERLYYLLFILSGAGLLLHVPRRRHLLEASFKGQARNLG